VRSPKGYFHSFSQAAGVFLAMAEGSDESQMYEGETLQGSCGRLLFCESSRALEPQMRPLTFPVT
jgi:hypothetical protein